MLEILETDRTPLVQQLLEIIHLQQDRIRQREDQVRLQHDCIQQLQERVHQVEDERARLKTRPRIAPSARETPPRPTRDPQAKRHGSAKRSQTSGLTLTEESSSRWPTPRSLGGVFGDRGQWLLHWCRDPTL